MSASLNRTDEERFANALDCDLYRLVCRAEARGGYWNAVARELLSARPAIRGRMHEKDRADTL